MRHCRRKKRSIKKLNVQMSAVICSEVSRTIRSFTERSVSPINLVNQSEGQGRALNQVPQTGNSLTESAAIQFYLEKSPDLCLYSRQTQLGPVPVAGLRVRSNWSPLRHDKIVLFKKTHLLMSFLGAFNLLQWLGLPSSGNSQCDPMQMSRT